MKGSSEERMALVGTKFIRIIKMSALGFMEDRCLLRASALTYTSLLSLVPFLTIAFAVLKGLGFEQRLELLLLEQFTPASQEVINKIMDYVDRTNASSLGVAGTVGLLLTAVMTMRNMEAAFNKIWKVARGRSWASTISNYVSVLLIVPICGLVALSLTTYFNSPGIVERVESVWILADFHRLAIRWSPLVILWVAFTACYALVPNTRVKLGSAMLGGILAAILWQLAQWAYVRYQFGVARYHAIYGALSQLPILMVWIYASWLIVLLGAEVARAHEQADRPQLHKTITVYPQAILEVLGAVSLRFASGQSPFRVGELLQISPMEPSLTRSCLEILQRLGWIAPCPEESDLVVFQKDPSQMDLSELVEQSQPMGKDGPAAFILEQIQSSLKQSLKGHKVAELVAQGIGGLPGTSPLPEKTDKG